MTESFLKFGIFLFLVQGLLLACAAQEGSLNSAAGRKVEESKVGTSDANKSLDPSPLSDTIVVPTPITGTYLVCARLETEEIGSLAFQCHATAASGEALPPEEIDTPTLSAEYQLNQDRELLQVTQRPEQSEFYWHYKGSRYPGGEFKLSAEDSLGNNLPIDHLPLQGDENFLRPTFLRLNLMDNQLSVTITEDYYQIFSRHSLSMYRISQQSLAGDWINQAPVNSPNTYCASSLATAMQGERTFMPANELNNMSPNEYLVIYLRDSANCPAQEDPIVDVLMIGINRNRQAQIYYVPFQL